MKTLNDPLLDAEAGDDRWTPGLGLWRGLWQGVLVAAALSLVLSLMAESLPYVIIIVWLRAPLAFGVAWVLLRAVQRAAGMVDPRCLAIALGLTAVVLVSNHIVFAIRGVPDCREIGDWWVFPMVLIQEIVPLRDGSLVGWEWCHPYSLLSLNALPLVVGGVFCAAGAGRD